MLKAIIFDFDGIIADTEPTHLEAFKRVLDDIDISLSDKAYYENYLAFDDKTLFSEILKYNERKPDHTLIKTLISKKNTLITRLFNEHVVPFPGLLNYLENIKDKYMLAIGSGSLRSEIILVLKKLGIENKFCTLTASEDIVNCKPDPEVFLTSLKSLNQMNNSNISPEECLVIEDSIHGIEAAKLANMKCMSITNTYSAELLKEADIVVSSFEEVDMNKVEEIFN